MFGNLEHLVLSRTEPNEMEVSQYEYNDMDRAWDTSKYHPKLSVSIFKVRVIKGHEGQGNVKLKILGLGGVIHVFGSVVCKDREKRP